MIRRWLAVALCALALGNTVHAQPPPQVLVMLRMAVPHLRASGSYGGTYAVSPGEAARMRIARALARQYGLQVVDNWPMPALGLDCFVMRIASGAQPADIAQAIAHDARVESAEPRQMFHTLSAGDPLYPLQPTATQWRLDALHAVSEGRGVTVAEIDSGVDGSQPDLVGQVAEQRDFVGAGPYRAELHGTEVAGVIVAREGNGVGIVGVAPRARLLALRACSQPAADDAAAACDSFTLAKAVQYALERHAQVINLSLAGPRDRLLERLLDAALAQGIVVVGAVDETAGDGGFPASCPGVVAVAGDHAATRDADVLLAPSVDIPVTQPGAHWNFASGSSFAAAQVSGLAALLRAVAPDGTLTALRDALHARPALGLVAMRPMPVDACAAMTRASRRCVCDCANTRASLKVPRR